MHCHDCGQSDGAVHFVSIDPVIVQETAMRAGKGEQGWVKETQNLMSCKPSNLTVLLIRIDDLWDKWSCLLLTQDASYLRFGPLPSANVM